VTECLVSRENTRKNESLEKEKTERDPTTGMNKTGETKGVRQLDGIRKKGPSTILLGNDRQDGRIVV